MIRSRQDCRHLDDILLAAVRVSNVQYVLGFDFEFPYMAMSSPAACGQYNIMEIDWPYTEM